MVIFICNYIPVVAKGGPELSRRENDSSILDDFDILW